MEIAIGIAGIAIVGALLLWAFGKKKETTEETSMPAAAGAGAMAASATPQPTRRYTNKKGWKAPKNHYFNEADELMSITGDTILDLMIIAEMCGITDFIPDAEPEVVVEEVVVAPEPVGSETIASLDETQPAPVVETVTEPVSAPEPAPAPMSNTNDFGSGVDGSKFSGAGYGGGGYGGDSGGDSGGSDCGGGDD